MASVKKFSHSAVVNQLRHVLREVEKPANTDIDPVRTELNYTISPDWGMHAYSYYLERKSQLYCFKRANVNTLAGWVVTVPLGLSSEQQIVFFRATYSFLEKRSGRENTVLACIHQDESRPHMHFLFIPATPDSKHGGYKVCANDVLTRAELRDFHPALQKHLKDAGIHARIVNYATTDENHTVGESKKQRKFEQILNERVSSK